MTKTSATVMVTLAGLTLVGFLGVSRWLIPRLTDGPTEVSRKENSSPLEAKNNRRNNEQKANEYEQLQRMTGKLAEAIKAGDWTGAKNLLAALRSEAGRLLPKETQSAETSPLLQDFYDYHELMLERAVSEQNTRSALIALNQLYGIIGEHRARLESRSVALELERLRYLVRELELWSGSGDEKMLAARAAALRAAWQDARLVLIARRDTDQAIRAFDTLIEKLATTRQARELSLLIPDFEKQLEQIQETVRVSRRNATEEKESQSGSANQ